MSTNPILVMAAGLLVFAGICGCRGPLVIAEGEPTLQLTSSSFQQGKMPKRSSCDGDEESPELAWPAPPPATKSLALIALDRDSRIYAFVHWIIYDLPPEKRELPEGLPRQPQLPDGSRQGQNDFDKSGYGGPCPHFKSAHHYVFVLYALDSKLDLPPGATRKQVERAARGHILAYGELTGEYQRQ